MFCKATKHSSCAKQKLYKMHTSTQSIFVQFCLEQEKCGCLTRNLSPPKMITKVAQQQSENQDQGVISQRPLAFYLSYSHSRKPLSSRPAPSPQSTKCSATHSNPASCPSCTVLVPNHFKFGTKKVGASSFPSFTFHRKTFFLQQRSFRPFGHLPSTKRTHHRRHTCTTKGGTALWHCFNAHHRPLGAILAVHVHRVHLFYYRTATPTDANNNCHEKKKSHESTQRPTVHTRVGPIGNARLYRATPRPSSNGR